MMKDVFHKEADAKVGGISHLHLEGALKLLDDRAHPRARQRLYVHAHDVQTISFTRTWHCLLSSLH
jgi:hypothetical protein